MRACAVCRYSDTAIRSTSLFRNCALEASFFVSSYFDAAVLTSSNTCRAYEPNAPKDSRTNGLNLAPTSSANLEYLSRFCCSRAWAAARYLDDDAATADGAVGSATDASMNSSTSTIVARRSGCLRLP